MGGKRLIIGSFISLRHRHQQVLPFDRVLGGHSTAADPPLTVYVADVLSPVFGEFHHGLSRRARQGEFSYRVRYRPSLDARTTKPLYLNGYGVGLSLKRTDYIVIDDRDTESQPSSIAASAESEGVKGDEEPDISDLKPLSSSELATLGINTAAFIKDSEDPFETLLRTTQDFPRHSSAIAGRNASTDFISELIANQNNGLRPGSNRVWVNGNEMSADNVDAFDLLSQLRHERQLIQGLKSIGLSAAESVSLLSHPTIAQNVKRGSGDVVRFDYRDHLEGGEVILWFNNIEKDKKYKSWSPYVQQVLLLPFTPLIYAAMLFLADIQKKNQYFPMYPGQMPVIRKDIHNCVIPVDLANEKDVAIVVKNIDMFLRRKIPIRFGIVPLLPTPESSKLAKVVYYLSKAYGPDAVMAYLQVVSCSPSKLLLNLHALTRL